MRNYLEEIYRFLLLFVHLIDNHFISSYLSLCLYPTDRQKGIFTLPVVLGEYPSQLLILASFILQNVLILYLVFNGIFGYPLLLCLLSIAYAWYNDMFTALLSTRPKMKPKDFPDTVWPLYFVAYAFGLNRYNPLYYLVIHSLSSYC